jgi:hypothetical protein
MWYSQETTLDFVLIICQTFELYNYLEDGIRVIEIHMLIRHKSHMTGEAQLTIRVCKLIKKE